MPGAALTSVKHLAANRAQVGLRTPEQGIAGTHHDGDGALLCADHTARYGRVHQLGSLVLRPLCQFPGL